MAVAFDAVGPSASGTTGASSPLTWTHVCGASATHLLVGATWDGSPDGGGSMSATYNSVSMTSLGVWHTGGGTAGFLQVWALYLPSTGSHSVSITAGGTPGGLNAGSISFTGSGGLSAVQSAVSAGSSANPTLAFTGSVSGNMVAAFVGGGSPQTPSGSFTSRYNENAGSGQQGAGYTAGSTIASPGGSTTASWTMSADFWAVAAVEVQAGTGPVQGPPQQRGGKRYRSHFGHRQTPIPALVAPPVVTVNAGVATASAVAPAAGAPRAVIAGLGGTGAGFFADQGGNPRFVLGDAVWGLPGNAGRWSSGAWQSDFDTYTSTRAGQGFTAIYTKPMGTTQNAGINDDGRTFDGLFPFQGGSFGNPSSGLTSSYWARIDYFLESARAAGLTVYLNAIGYDSDFETSGPLSGKSASEFQSYGAAIGARYASQVNLIWMVADDYFGSSDTKIDSFLTGLRSGGANQPISIENFPESDSRQDITAGTSTAWGASNAQFNFCYSYNVTYYGVEKAYLESSPITVIQGDGYFYQGGSTYAGGSGAAAYDRAIRQDAWHAISSGARGIIHGDEACWQWASTAQAAATNNWYQKNNAGNIRTLMESLPNWQKLVPDTSSLLVTAGRGTHASGFTSGGGGGQYEVAFTDSYVSASRTPDGGSGSDLAVIYLSHATTITVDQTKMVSGYQAFWVDPITGSKTSTTAGSSYNSATPGNNSQGDPDWVLVLQAASSTVTASAGVATAAGSALAPAAAITVTAGVATATGTAPASVAAESVSPVAAAASGTACAPAVAETSSAGVATASGVSLAPQAAAAISAAVATATGTALAPVAAITVIAAVAAASGVALQPTVNTSGNTNAPAGVASAAGSALAPQVAIAAASAAAAGTGSAPAPQAAVTTPAAVAAATATARAPVPALAVLPAAGTGQGTALAAAVQTSSGTSANAGVATASALALAPAKAITLAAAAAQGAGVALAAVTPPPFTVGKLTAATAAGSTLTAATAPLSVLTAKDQRTGGSGG